MGGNGVEVGFAAFGEPSAAAAAANLGMTYAGFSKLKQELPGGYTSPPPSSRPPWAMPPMGPASSATGGGAAACAATAASGAAPKSFADLAPQHHSYHQNVVKQQQQQQQQQQDHYHLPLLGGAPASARSFAELHAAAAAAASPFALPYETQVGSSSLYKTSSPSAAPASAYGGSRSRHYPLQFSGGSLVLDHHRGELINMSKMTQQEILDAKALAASKSHSEAERRRRERINNHLNTLRSLLPSTTKTDKASLLAEVIEHVKDLKRQAAEIAEGGPVPSDVDELKVDTDSSSTEGNLVMKASLCCDDRPDLLTDLTKVLKTLKLKTLKAEIATLGGRVKNVIVIGKDAAAAAAAASSAGGGVQAADGDHGTSQEPRPSVNCVQEALRAVIERSNDLSAAAYSGSKRQKLNHHHEAAASSY